MKGLLLRESIIVAVSADSQLNLGLFTDVTMLVEERKPCFVFVSCDSCSSLRAYRK